jgi:hypothetical protein
MSANLSPDEEKSMIKKVFEAPMNLGEVWFIVSSKWWESWKSYVNFEDTKADVGGECIL